MSEHMLHVTDDSFEEEVLSSELPVLVDFWAEWCGPCRAIAPLLDDISREYEARLKVAKLDVDESPKTPQNYGVRGIPTLMIFKAGEVEGTKIGSLSKSDLNAFIEKHI
ncbi:MAG: thioredoxin TrxA [Gammaproteobacteria bacterium]|jgi:thioredoxin 1|nr:thioredoxin TrxA [Beggiatoa sp.]